MKIAKDTAVTIRYRITDLATGKLLEDGQEPTAYLHGGYGNTFARVEEALEGQEQGYQTRLELQPTEAFGERDERLVQIIPKIQFPPGVKVGGQLEGRGEDGHAHVFTVKKIKGPEVHLDGNHPLAGRALRIDLTVLDVRTALAEEIAHGHVHGAHGHHH
ncbi:MAG: peptidylprolyl isomerase [Curvibacter sp.]|jgi:FKBP-type peptidyl-prolyl cis-trans isomerase SlyD|nr:peptidylprolyl isomerase [Curvibacter sp.]